MNSDHIKTIMKKKPKNYESKLSQVNATKVTISGKFGVDQSIQSR